MSGLFFLRINHPHIIHEIIDGEAILVNLETGSYYSSDQVGAIIWDGIENGMAVEQIAEAVAGAYTGDAAEIQERVHAFARQLQGERLVLPGTQAHENGSHTIPTLPVDKPPFVAPALKKYTEMEDLLLLDPIHDVDDAGWPHRAEDHA